MRQLLLSMAVMLCVPPIAAADPEMTAHRMLTDLSRAELRLRVPSAEIVDSPLTGEPQIIHAHGEALTPPAPDRPAAEVALDFLRQNAGIWGLLARDVDDFEVIGESVGRGGLRTVRIRRPDFRPDLRALVDADGGLLRIQPIQELHQ